MKKKLLILVVMALMVSMFALPALAWTNGHTPGFWGNKNGQALISGEDLAMLNALNLWDANGPVADFQNFDQFKAWLRGGTAVEMKYMLSVQLAAMELNVLNGFVDAGVIDPVFGQHWIQEICDWANDALADPDADRGYLEDLKNCLDAANNNLIWCP